MTRVPIKHMRSLCKAGERDLRALDKNTDIVIYINLLYIYKYSALWKWFFVLYEYEQTKVLEESYKTLYVLDWKRERCR